MPAQMASLDLWHQSRRAARSVELQFSPSSQHGSKGHVCEPADSNPIYEASKLPNETCVAA